MRGCTRERKRRADVQRWRADAEARAGSAGARKRTGGGATEQGENGVGLVQKVYVRYSAGDITAVFSLADTSMHIYRCMVLRSCIPGEGGGE